ncbi:MAG: hypothetical protein QE271_10180 [Bacteriovoracaceae bacterium]|nr:hypothetical protein [Bacteriovoracaceae bacterium]
MESLPKMSRRVFFKTAALTAGALALAKQLGSQAWAAATASDAKILEKSAQKQAYKRISPTSLPTEPQFKTHKTNLDKAITELKIDNKAGKIIPQCANCLQYKPKAPGDEFGACPMVQATLAGAEPVGAHKTGWCKVYAVKKDKTIIEKSAN